MREGVLRDRGPEEKPRRHPRTAACSAGFQTCCIADFQIGWRYGVRCACGQSRRSEQTKPLRVWKPAIQQTWMSALHGGRANPPAAGAGTAGVRACELTGRPAPGWPGRRDAVRTRRRGRLRYVGVARSAPLGLGPVYRSAPMGVAESTTASRPGGTPPEISRGQVRAARTPPPVRRRNWSMPRRGIEEWRHHRAELPPVPLRGRDIYAATYRGPRRSPCPRLISSGAPLAQGHVGAAARPGYRRRPRLRVRAASRRPNRHGARRPGELAGGDDGGTQFGRAGAGGGWQGPWFVAEVWHSRAGRPRSRPSSPANNDAG